MKTSNILATGVAAGVIWDSVKTKWFIWIVSKSAILSSLGFYTQKKKNKKGIDVSLDNESKVLAYV